MPPAKKMPAKGKSKKPAPNTPAPPGTYALPGGGPGGADAYPIMDRAHAANALARVTQFGTPAEQAKVRAAVKRKYPDLPSSQGKGDSPAARANKPKSSKPAKPAK
jgi:hypothetical protein